MVHRTVSVPSGSGWSKATADSRYRFSRPRNRATISRVAPQSATSSPKVAVPRSISIARMAAVCSATETGEA